MQQGVVSLTDDGSSPLAVSRVGPAEDVGGAKKSPSDGQEDLMELLCKGAGRFSYRGSVSEDDQFEAALSYPGPVSSEWAFRRSAPSVVSVASTQRLGPLVVAKHQGALALAKSGAVVTIKMDGGGLAGGGTGGDVVVEGRLADEDTLVVAVRQAGAECRYELWARVR